VKVYRHADVAHVREQLEASRSSSYELRLVVTESVYSMDGDLAKLDRIVELADRYDAAVIVDDSHATGVLGRYLYSLSPRPNLTRLNLMLTALNAIGPGMGQVLGQRVASIAPTEPPARPSLLAVLRKVPSWRREAHQRRDVIRQTVAQYAHYYGPEVQLLSKPIAECMQIYTAEVRAAAAGALLKSWRGLHRFAALLMVALVAMHIGVAWYYGFVWIFSS